MKWKQNGWKRWLPWIHRPRKTENDSFFRKHRTLLPLAVPLLAGVGCGCALCRKWNPETESGIARLVEAFLERRESPAFWTEFAYSFESVLFFFLILFFGGVSLLGAVLIPCVLLMRGLGIGAVIGSLCIGYGTSGMLYSVFAVLPFACGTSALLLLQSKEGIRFSGKLFRTLCAGENRSIRQQFGRYCLRSAAVLVLLGMASLADSALNLLMKGIL